MTIYRMPTLSFFPRRTVSHYLLIIIKRVMTKTLTIFIASIIVMIIKIMTKRERTRMTTKKERIKKYSFPKDAKMTHSIMIKGEIWMKIDWKLVR